MRVEERITTPSPDGALTRRTVLRGLGIGVVGSGVAVATGARPAGAQETPLLEAPLVDITVGLTGTAVELAAANPILPAGGQAFATDTNQLFVGDGTRPLVELTPLEPPSGVEIASATDGEARSFSNTYRDYPNLTIGPFTVPAGKVAYVHLFLPNAYNTGAQTFATFTLVHGTASSAPVDTAIDDAVCALIGTGGVFTTVDKMTVGRIGPGTHTVKVKVFDSKEPGSTDVNFQGLAKARLWALLA